LEKATPAWRARRVSTLRTQRVECPELVEGLHSPPEGHRILIDVSTALATVYVYILQCADGSYYVGITEDLGTRVERHNAGTAAAWTACRCPVTLVYFEQFDDLESAVARETQFKGWSRAKKAALISRNQHALKELSRCRAQHGN
jgi:predicted GIY-YIG superfamily endonuclease